MIQRNVHSRQRWGLPRLLKLEAVAAAIFALTAVVLFFGESLNAKHLRLVPRDPAIVDDPYLFNDEGSGGASKVAPAADRPMSWTCNLTRTYEHGYCGFGLPLNRQQGRGLDLKGFDSVTAKLAYAGPGDMLRLALKHSDPHFRAADGSSLDKPAMVSFSVTQGRQVARIHMHDFTVPDWWKDGSGSRAAASDINPEFTNIVALEILTGADSAIGEHRVTLEEVVFTGSILPPKLRYGAIGGCWAFLIALLLVRRRKQERLVRELADSWRTTLNAIPQMVWSYDDQGTHFNERWQLFTGVAVGLRRTDPLALVHRADRSAAVSALRRSVTRGSALQQQLRLKHVSGGYRWVLAQGTPTRTENGEIVGWYGTCTDVHDRVLAETALKKSIASAKAKSAQLKWTSEHDSLTQLPNRRAFQDRLEAACRGASAGDFEFALLLIDLDHFKHVNDSLGHATGDELLKALGGRLKHSVRHKDFVARVGGDEFAVIVQDVDCAEAVLAIGNALHKQISGMVRIDNRSLSSGASIGGACCPTDATNSSDLFKAADIALYELKSAGRGGTQMFRKEMLDAAERSASQLRLARLAVHGDSVVPFYQPKFSVKTGALVGFEALLRWRDQDSVLQLPDSLGAAFEDYELATRIGNIMHQKVARDVKGWGARRLPFGRVSINASPAEFLRDDYAARLCAVLEAHGVPGEWIEVEVTEHVLLKCGSSHVASALRELKLAGISIALDDFGTGYSSLSHLRDFPVDSVKIDRSFIENMLVDPEIGAIVVAVATLARNLGLEVVAEGVETTSQLEYLRTLGCNVAQGHLLGAAMDAGAAEQLLSAKRAAA